MEPLREQIFDSKIEKRFLRWYRRFFSIKEIETEKVLQWVMGATVLSHFVAFHGWFYNRSLTIDAYLDGQHRCWPYFQSCGEWAFLRALPEGYSQPFVYMVLFGTLLLTVYLMYKKEWVLAHMALLPSFIWHTLGTFVLTTAFSGNYDFYLALFSVVLLLLPHKTFFLKLTLVLTYFLAVTIKFHDGWVLGTYFSAMKTGLPIFPDWSIPVWTNLVIFSQIVAAWFLLSRNYVLQRITLTYFVMFHLYSGLLVGFRYPSTVLPTLIILFGMFYAHTHIPWDRKAIGGWFLVIIMFTLQFISIIIPGDEKLTLEGNRYGLYMFESNHQCISTIHIIQPDGSEEEHRTESESARHRCSPYTYWFPVVQNCDLYEQEGIRIAWTFDHSINGGPFLRIVDEQNICALEYKAFSHNEWIKTHEDNPEVIGYPVENHYR